LSTECTIGAATTGGSYPYNILNGVQPNEE
jgi:hypothetical protein